MEHEQKRADFKNILKMRVLTPEEEGIRTRYLLHRLARNGSLVDRPHSKDNYLRAEFLVDKKRLSGSIITLLLNRTRSSEVDYELAVASLHNPE